MTVWTTPRTWVTGEVLSSTNFNTHIRDNLSYLKDGNGTPAIVAHGSLQLTVNGNTIKRCDSGTATLTVPTGFSTDVSWGTFSFATAFAAAPMVIANGLRAASGVTAVRPGTITTTTCEIRGPGGGNNPDTGTVYWIAVGATG